MNPIISYVVFTAMMETWDKMPLGCGPCGEAQSVLPKLTLKPSTPSKCCELGSVPRLLAFLLFSVWDSHLESLKELGARQWVTPVKIVHCC
jgi:hypothetical protein